MSLKIKICGMKEPSNIREVSLLHPDYMGFIFHRKSPRCCISEGKDILGEITSSAKPVMVSVNMPEEELVSVATDWGFRILQLHGDESPETCGRLRNKGFEVWKAISISDSADGSPFDSLEDYAGNVDMFLFDTATAMRGGSGKRFDWALLDKYNGGIPFMLSGGISPESADEILELQHPRLSGIDLNSRFEISPALKDPLLLRSFLEKFAVLPIEAR